MENSVIAVQIANGTFVPVLNTSSNKRRRLVVTTVRDNQTNVKIELFRGSDESMADPEYVGSLIIENIDPTESGGPDISVLLGVDDSGNFNATATDTSSGEYQSLSVGLDQLEQEGGYDMPDFQLNDEEDFDLATPSELDELSLDDEPVAEEPTLEELSLEELSLDDENDFDLSSLDLDTEPESESEPTAPEPLEPGPTELGPTEPAPAAESEPEASDDIFSFDEEPQAELGDDGLDELSLDEPEELALDEPVAEAPSAADEPVAGDEPALEELSLDDEDDFDLSALDLDDESDLDTGPEPEPALPEPLDPGSTDPGSTDPAPAAESEPEASDDIFSFDEEPLAELGDDDGLDELSLDEPEELTPDESAADEPAAAVESEPDVSDDIFSLDDEDDFDLSALDTDLDTGPELESESETPESLEPTSTEAESEPLSELGDDDGLGDFSFDELDSDELSFDELSTPNAEETAALTDVSDEDFSFDESLSSEGEELGDLDEGLVEADLGDEDFTFDEGVEDEPLFAEPEPLEEDTLSPEEFDRLDSQPLPAPDVEPVADEAMQPRRSNAIIFVGYMILALAALGVVTYLVFRLMEGPPAPPLRAGLLGRLSSAWVLLGVPVVRRRRKG